MSRIKFKKFVHIMQGIGASISVFAVMCDPSQHPVLAIPVILGLIVVYIGQELEKEEISEKNNRNNRSRNIGNSDISYTTYGSDGNIKYPCR